MAKKLYRIRDKLKFIEKNSMFKAVLIDIVRELECNTFDGVDSTDIELAMLVNQVVGKVSNRYKLQLKSEDVASKQTDIEDLIMICRLEEYAKQNKEV